ncbi:MAG: DUF294 nucleotidyltransferase-like domain-containing protein [Pseudonocardia sp.]|nr:DUF294 nucleotidyltransferase-like domain-containing protein [Pseudonocardia sp.]
MIALHDARVAAGDVAGITAVVVDAVTRRLVDLAVDELGAPPRPLTWLALGSVARREAVPSSDVDSALVWVGPESDADAARHCRALAGRVLAGLAAAGFPADANGAVATNDPAQEKAPILVSLVVDARPVWGVRASPAIPDVFRDARRHLDLLRLLGRYALAHRPPTGFLRDVVVEHSGRRRGRLDLKRGGLVPIVDLARWAGMAAGVTSGSTPARLRAAAAADTLDADAAATRRSGPARRCTYAGRSQPRPAVAADRGSTGSARRPGEPRHDLGRRGMAARQPGRRSRTRRSAAGPP